MANKLIITKLKVKDLVIGQEILALPEKILSIRLEKRGERRVQLTDGKRKHWVAMDDESEAQIVQELRENDNTPK